jgi:hypothetical protein
MMLGAARNPLLPELDGGIVEKVATPSSPQKVTPFLVARSVRRTEGRVLPGSYNPTMQVWAVEGAEGLEPLVSSELPILDLATKTKVERERDDQQSMVVLSAITKTAVQLEQDDDKIRTIRCASIPELATKTEAVPERDD